MQGVRSSGRSGVLAVGGRSPARCPARFPNAAFPPPPRRCTRAGWSRPFGLVAGLVVDAFLRARGAKTPAPHVEELCAHSRCGCTEHKGIVVPALIHTAEIFFFILIVSGIIEIALHFAGEDVLKSFVLNKPVLGELLAGVAGMVPNCAVSVAFAQLYVDGGMSAGALMAGSLAGSGLGLLVLFRTNRRLKDNLLILAAVYLFGVVFGHLAGYLF